MNRVLVAARLHLPHSQLTFGIPWLVVLASFAVNYALWAVADIGAESPDAWTGGLFSLYAVLFFTYVAAFTQLLPFAMGISLGRRTFYLGTVLVACVQAVAFSLALTVLAAVERVTDGWGVRLAFWAPPPLAVDDHLLQVLVYLGPMLASIAVGVGSGVVVKRWGASGAWTLVIGVLLLAGASAVLVTGLEGWAAVGRWLVDRTLLQLAFVGPALVAVAVAALSWLGLRRVVP
ncbi:hypothetical protein [Geodermatophilus marinus]|uniref:hypothetical protein n=1 Tax=Geodermatophilus sp. LHW52908 TaxID=2303986 RepID=UPI000E3EAB8E|nr:hypothetical protein [Geodermatophilus sp. LHW52908]RFU21455.1 hypothetical protein D0Z06_11860 [Geodermatophilus sp. LHW52908]